MKKVCAFVVLCGIPLTLVVADSKTSVVPEKEQQIAQEKHMDGPKENKGLKAELLGSVDLGKEFEGMQGRELRARMITIEPGGMVAVHQHDSRPGLAFILEGEVLEHRNDSKESVLRGKGQIVFENTGVTHWWKNQSKSMVKALVVDIIKSETKK